MTTSAPPADALVYRVLADGRLVHGAQPPGLVVAGHLQRGRFVATSDVIGDGPLATDGHPGWLELSTGRFVAAETAAVPVPPYVDGVMTTMGFVPGTRSVIRS